MKPLFFFLTLWENSLLMITNKIAYVYVHLNIWTLKVYTFCVTYKQRDETIVQ